MSDEDPPFRPDASKLYRVWYTTRKNGVEVQERIVGHVFFKRDGDAWGLWIERPGDTSIYLRSFDRIQEAQETNGGGL